MNFLANLFLALVWIVSIGLVLTLVVVTSAAGASLGFDGGPTSFIGGALIATSMMVALLYWPARTVAEIFAHRESEQTALTAVFLAILFYAGMVTPASAVSYYNGIAVLLSNNAETVSTRGPQLFDYIDANRDGILDESELKGAKSDSTLSRVDNIVVTDLLSTLNISGHVIGSRKQDTFLMVGDVPVSDTVDVPVYGISKSDLEVYTTRIYEKYKNWL